MTKQDSNLWHLCVQLLKADSPQYAIQKVASFLYTYQNIQHIAFVDTRVPDFYKFESGELAWMDNEICMTTSLSTPIRNIKAQQQGFETIEKRLRANANAYHIFPLLPEVMIILATSTPNTFLDSEDWNSLIEVLSNYLKKVDNDPQKYKIANHRYKAILDSISDGLIVIDLNNHIQFFNPQMEKISGYTLDEVRGRNAYKTLSSEKQAKLLAKATLGLAEDEEASFMGQLQTKDKKLVWVQIKRTPYRDFDGKIVGYIGTIKDLTEQNRTHQLVKDNEARLNHILATTLDAFILMDAQLKVLEWNKQAEDIFGYTKEDTIGNSLKTLIVPPHLHEAYFLGIQYFIETNDDTILNQRIETIAKH
ncbi:MAG: PAS domain S-box protein, partial [Saprospiraceae bacterium]|nr:PAS domain S-box protein [Saprospiraceae bacterium]